MEIDVHCVVAPSVAVDSFRFGADWGILRIALLTDLEATGSGTPAGS